LIAARKEQCFRRHRLAASKVKGKKSAEKGNWNYAIVQTGGKQYKVSSGETIDVAHLHVAEGSAIELDQVLMVADGERVRVGTPTVEGAKVIAEVIGDGKGKKIIVFKYKPKVRYRRMKGHRQLYTRLAIKEIVC
jgi:large subunit ribosomal protein L21